MATVLEPTQPEPVPEGRTERVTEVDDDIEVSFVALRSPLPSDFPAHPPDCDTLGYLRYRAC
ncbi:MAG: hypothetical protein ACRD0G_12195 [Acidimicrobiales bacterium]